MMVRTIAFLLLAGVLGGCVAQGQRVSLSRPFVMKDFDGYDKVGLSTIRGNAYLVGADGLVLKVAGQDVALVPYNSFTEELHQVFVDNPYAAIVNLSPSYRRFVRTTRTNADGTFTFAQVPAGQFYVMTSMSTLASSGQLMNRWHATLLSTVVAIGDEEELTVTLSRGRKLVEVLSPS